MDSKMIPTDIQNKIAMLEHHKAEVKRLKQLLEVSEQQCRLLESDLVNYRASLAPIRKCPAEILAAIFRAYLENNPRHIRRLLLVCRLWYNLTHQTPDLWTNIPIIFDSGSEPAKDVVDSIKPRVVACIKYSQNLPLDIDLDLSKLCKTLDYIKDQARIFEDNYLLDLKFNFIRIIHQSQPPSEAHFSPTPWNSYHILELLDVLAGSANENLKRWKSFNFKLPESFMNEDVMPIWDRLAGPLPCLVSLSIKQCYESSLDPPSYMVFADLKSLQHLTLSDVAYLSCLDIVPTTIHILDICSTLYEKMHDLQLSRFRFLRVLKLRGDWALSAPRHSTSTLNLPELESIAFMGGIRSTKGIDFNLPLLKHLYIQESPPTFFIDPPALSATSITWVIYDYDEEEWTSTLKEEALKALLRRCSSVEMLTITEDAEDALLPAISDLGHTGELPSSLRIVRIVRYPDMETILRTRTLA